MINVEGNPNIRRCDYGHYYEVKKHSECPYCKEEYKTRNGKVKVTQITELSENRDGRTEILFLDE